MISLVIRNTCICKIVDVIKVNVWYLSKIMAKTLMFNNHTTVVIYFADIAPFLHVISGRLSVSAAFLANLSL